MQRVANIKLAFLLTECVLGQSASQPLPLPDKTDTASIELDSEARLAQ